MLIGFLVFTAGLLSMYIGVTNVKFSDVAKAFVEGNLLKRGGL